MDREYLLCLLTEIKAVQKSGKGKLPQNSFFLDYDKVVCCAREKGESRYPYESDGLTVWLRSTGYIDALESNFNILKISPYGEDSVVNFFGGIKNETGEYTPVSVTGSARNLSETGVNRYILYTLQCAYCFAEVQDMVFVLRLHVDKQKHIHFSLCAINTADEQKEIYLASFIEAILRYGDFIGSKRTKYGKHYENGFILTSDNDGSYDSLVINSKLCGCKAQEQFFTAARSDFLGTAGISIAHALSLKRGAFERQVPAVTVTDLPVAADIFRLRVGKDDFIRLEYDLALSHSYERDKAESYLGLAIDPEKIDLALEKAAQQEKNDFDNLTVRFENWNSEKISADTFSKFLRSVQKQVSFCAHGKNYAGPYIGVRDVFQQLEGSLIWQRDIAREKILLAMNYIMTTGRPPRQFSIPVFADAPVAVNLKKYIDQGVWIISTIYAYLAFTGDYSILNEECGYIEADETVVMGYAKRSDKRDSVLIHLKKIMDYLLSNLDAECGTYCLRALFGDWNDALDGLGKTDDPDKEYGSGVTVMATLQFYQNLREMQEILRKIGDPEAEALCRKYSETSAKIAAGLLQYAVDTNQDGCRRIVHGWGDKLGYKVGSWNDPDGAARYSLTANSFWAITKFLQVDPTLKTALMDCMNAVSSEYGLRAFDVPFPIDTKGVGRITRLLPGTYENCCAYVHGSLFGTMALFEMGESKRAWEEIEKSAVITHENCTLSTFAMANCYCKNEEYSMDGESLVDWHTGSGCVIIKETVRYGFGIYPTLDGLRLQFPRYFPAESGSITVNVKNSTVHLHYTNRNTGKRSFEIEGADGIVKSFDTLMDIDTYFIPEENMGKEITVTICD